MSVAGMAGGCRTPGEARVSHAMMPDWVRAEAAEQIESYFGKGPFRGVPLLDGKKEWSRLANWPEKFRFRGYVFNAEYARVGSDWLGLAYSKEEFGTGTGFSIHYKIRQTNTTTAVHAGYAVHQFYSYWSKHGHTRPQGIRWNGETVLSFDYYPDGRLHSFAREVNGEEKGEYFGLDGRVVGWRHGPGFYWDGKEVSVEKFQRELGRLRAGFPEMDWE